MERLRALRCTARMKRVGSGLVVVACSVALGGGGVGDAAGQRSRGSNGLDAVERLSSVGAHRAESAAGVGARRFQRSEAPDAVPARQSRKDRRHPLGEPASLASAQGSQQQDSLGLSCPHGGTRFRISAQLMSGATPIGAPVTRRLTGGPGPSIVDLPAPGCWRLTLRWSRSVDSLDLRYAASR